ncbi:hypothetical protein DPEC_G00317320 [Dallia pectoralis]|uniref:Uncharacterized protein n=1 Tax=Dallia pectoralis TaxID=75939 RepID=A0ACC2FCT1_DALPE|nr:hypothetical protein DPEC_G00317320 [Dallia pectoralis]
MLIVFLLVCLLSRTACLKTTRYVELSFRVGSPVSVVGEKVQMLCSGPILSSNYTWYHQNQTVYTGNDTYTLFVALENSGEYKCSCYDHRTVNYSEPVTMTIVERLSQVWVSSTSLAAIEGQSVTLGCEASSAPLSVSWTWTRMNASGGMEAVDAVRVLTLSAARQSGQYQCHAHSTVLGRTQSQNSSVCTVYILSFPLTGSVYAGVAGLVLALLALVCVLLVMLWGVRLLANGRTTPLVLGATESQAKGLAKPAKAPKGRQFQGQMEDTEVYMNCDRPSQNYTNLCPAYMTGGDTYATLG